jgi:hypothetical protein
MICTTVAGASGTPHQFGKLRDAERDAARIVEDEQPGTERANLT